VLLAHASSFEYDAAEAEKAGGTSYIVLAYRFANGEEGGSLPAPSP
jgi:hypothetical protein